MSYTEYCAKTGGSKLNAGTLDGSSTEPSTTPFATYNSGTWANPTFTVSSGNPVTDGVVVGMFAALNNGGTEALYIARITAVTSTTITLAGSGWGSVPASGTLNLRVGGAWPIPNGTDWWPFTLTRATSGGKDATGRPIRVNLKSPGSPVDITGGGTYSTNGENVTYQGYGSSYGDGTKIYFLGPATGTSFVMLTLSSFNHILADIHFDRNGSSGANHLVVCGNDSVFYRCRFSRSRHRGLANSNSSVIVECMFDQNNQSNSGDSGGLHTVGGGTLVLRCVSVNNVTEGFGGGNYYAVNCIAANNGGLGFSSPRAAINCCSYNNTNSGIRYDSRSYIENVNVLKNGGYGLQANSINGVFPVVRNVGYGAGTQANVGGSVDTNHIISADEAGGFFYPSGETPWNDPINSDFRLIHDLSTGTGRGRYHPDFNVANIGYPDVGAVTRTPNEVTNLTGQSIINGVLNGMRVKKNTALNNFQFFMRDASNPAIGKTGLTVTATRSIDGGAFAACANAPVEIGNGWYKINLAAADLNGDTIALNFSSSGAVTSVHTIITQTA
jgi:hypothetical protein